jgi:DNA invertase Pin-like site-specific DNA recombinase
MRNVIYCRVSNLKKDSQSFAVQEHVCATYCKSNNLTIREIHKEYNSGYGKQKILHNLILKSKNINLIINDITRFSRNSIYGGALLKICQKHNITIHFVKENIKYPSEETYGLIEDGLINSENEWKSIRSRIINNVAYRRHNGLSLGTAPFGFDCDPNTKKLIKNSNFNAIRLIVSLRNGVKDINGIRQILSVLSTESELLKFYEYDTWNPTVEKEISSFSETLTLDFKTITSILNEYKVCGKHWIPSRVQELYTKNKFDQEFKEETEFATKFENSKKCKNILVMDYDQDFKEATKFPPTFKNSKNSKKISMMDCDDI